MARVTDNHTPFKTGYRDRVTRDLEKNSIRSSYGATYTISDHYMPTKKQIKYIEDLKKICADKGIDLKGFGVSTRNKEQCSRSIRSLISLLKRYGYDTHGNPLEVPNE